MALPDIVTGFASWLRKPLVERAVKTIVEVTATQAAVYTTLVPNPPALPVSVTISAGAGLGSVILNLALAWATKAKNARLDALAAAIDKLVDERLKEQAVPDAA